MATTEVARPARGSAPERARIDDPEAREAHEAQASAPPRLRAARWRAPVALAAVVLGLVAGYAIAHGIALAGDDGSRDVLDGLGLVATDLVLLAVVVAFARRGAERLTPATFAIRRTRFWPALGWTLLVYFVISIAAGLWITFVAGPGLGAGGGRGSAQTPSVLVGALVVLGVAITAPIAEELAFRGYLFPALTRWRGPWISALLTALLFGAAHAAVYPPAFLPVLAFFGFGACMLLWFTRSLLPSVALHALNNGIAVGAALGWSWQVPLVALGAPVVAVLLLTPLARERAPRVPVTA